MNNDKPGADGRLPAMAPLANPYVPFQLNDPPRYDPRLALVRGTLYPGLDLPFMGMVNSEEMPVTPSTQLQTLSFGIQELALYLDTHREDQQAFELYKAFQQKYCEIAEEYEKANGPLNHNSVANQKTYKWLDDPWPWEYKKNREA